MGNMPLKGEARQPLQGERFLRLDCASFPAMGTSLRQLRLERGWTHDEAAKRMGVSRGQFIKLERGERGLTARTIALAAKAFEVPQSEILETKLEAEVSTVVQTDVPSHTIRVAGLVAAGVYREAEDFGYFVHKPVTAMPDPEFPDARQVAFIVEGDSMDSAKPFPMPNGSTLVCIDYEDVDSLLPLRSGMKVVVERVRDNGLLREWSCKEIKIHADEVEFLPRSSNARHKPFSVARDQFADDGGTVRVLAIVRQVIVNMPLD